MLLLLCVLQNRLPGTRLTGYSAQVRYVDINGMCSLRVELVAGLSPAMLSYYDLQIRRLLLVVVTLHFPKQVAWLRVLPASPFFVTDRVVHVSPA